MKGILLDDNLELQIKLNYDAGGKITAGAVVGNSINQVQEFIIRAGKGEIKETPTKGVGIVEYIDDDTDENLIRAIRTELINEGMKVKSLAFDSNNNLIIDAE